MKVVFIGKLPTKAIEGLKANNIDVVFLAGTVADAIDWISVNGDFEAVVLIQKGINRDQDAEKQVFALQEIMGAMNSKARLLAFLTSKELYDSVKEKNIVKYSPSYLSYNDQLMLSQVYEVLHKPELFENKGVVKEEPQLEVKVEETVQEPAIVEELVEVVEEPTAVETVSQVVEEPTPEVVEETVEKVEEVVESISEVSIESEEVDTVDQVEEIQTVRETVEKTEVVQTVEETVEEVQEHFEEVYVESQQGQFEEIYTEPEPAFEEVAVSQEIPVTPKESMEDRTKRLFSAAPVENEFTQEEYVEENSFVHSDITTNAVEDIDMELDTEYESVDFLTIGKVEEEAPFVDEELEKAKEEFTKEVETEVYREVERVEKLNKFHPPVNCYSGDNKKTIVVLSLFSDSGSSFIANNMAVLLGRANRTVSVVEHLGNKGSLYSYLNGPAMEPDNWRSIASRVEDGSSVNGRDYWRDGTISWFPKSNKDGHIEVTDEKMVNYLTATNVSEFTFIDVSTNWEDPALRKVYDKCHEIWVVFKPNVAKLVEPLMHLKEHMGRWSDKIQFIGNGFDSYTKDKEVLDQIDYLISNSKEFVENPQSFGGGRDYYLWKDHNVNATIPQLGASVVSKAEWKGFMVAQTEEGRGLAKAALMVLLNKVSPQSTAAIPEKKQRKNLLGKFFKKAN